MTTISPINVEKYLKFLVECRDSHEYMLTRYRNAPDSIDKPVPWSEAVGDEQFHVDCIEEYNLIIEMLRGMLSKKDGC